MSRYAPAGRHAPPLERVLARVVIISSGCWLWPGARNDRGYGVVGWQGKNLYVHRVVYEGCVGPIPAGLEIDHLCRVRACANPDHLEAVTRRVNTLRGAHPLAALHRANRCIRGHPLAGPGADVYVRKEGQAMCRACERIRRRTRRAERALAEAGD